MPTARHRRLIITFILVIIAAGIVWLFTQPPGATTTFQASHGQESLNPFLSPQVEDLGWPFLRGPRFDGNSPEIHIADAWPAEGPPVLWARKLGQGYSGFVARGNRVYTQYQTLGGQFVACLDADTGATVWEHRYDWPFDPAGIYPGPRATPTLSGDRVYFAAPSGEIGCLDSEGELLWKTNPKEMFEGKGTDFGYSCSPTVIDNKIILPIGGAGASMVALDVDNGSVIWKSGDEPASYTPALPIELDGQALVIGYLQNSVVCFDRDTGKVLWQHDLSVAYDEHSAWPIYEEPYLWLSGPFRAGSQLLELKSDEKLSFTRLRQSEWMSNDVASSVLVDGHVYGFDLREFQSKAHRPSRGTFRCLEFLSGRECWSNGDPSERRDLPQQDEAESKAGSDPDQNRVIGHASVIAVDGKLILFNDSGELILAQADPASYQELARATILRGEVCWTSPTLHRGRVYLRNHAQAVCLYVGTPELMPRTEGTQNLTVNDIPQASGPWNPSEILGIEPEYALDPPTHRWLWMWYGLSLSIMAVSGIAALLLRIALKAYLSYAQARWIFWAFAFLLGLLVAKPLSLSLNEFIFTWPVSLFVAFQATAYQVQLRKHDELKRTEAWRGRMVGAAFLAVCVGYYAVCRQLSLITEWIFLCGFPAAVVFLLVGRWYAEGDRRYRFVMEALFTVIAFTAFFWTSAALLSLKYEILDF